MTSQYALNKTKCFHKFSHISKGFQNFDPGLRSRPRQRTPTCVLKIIPDFDQLQLLIVTIFVRKILNQTFTEKKNIYVGHSCIGYNIFLCDFCNHKVTLETLNDLLQLELSQDRTYGKLFNYEIFSDSISTFLKHLHNFQLRQQLKKRLCPLVSLFVHSSVRSIV